MAEKAYIEREALLELINEDCKYKNPTNEYTRGCNEVCDWAIKTIRDMPAADVVPKSQYDLAVAEREANVKGFAVGLEAMRGAANSYKMHYENLAREIFRDINREIKEALKSNYNAKSERLKSPCIDMADEFIGYCEGKIDALREIQNFIDKLKEKYRELK